MASGRRVSTLTTAARRLRPNGGWASDTFELTLEDVTIKRLGAVGYRAEALR